MWGLTFCAGKGYSQCSTLAFHCSYTVTWGFLYPRETSSRVYSTMNCF